MYLATLPVNEAAGHILRHNIADASGRKALPKGRRLTSKDLARLEELGHATVRVAVLEAGDIHEDEAARRLGAVVCGDGVTPTAAVHSRVNLLAEADGIVEIDSVALLELNDIDGLTIATLPAHTLVRARNRVATIKIIPFAVPEETMLLAEAIGRRVRGVVGVRRLRHATVGVILAVSPAARTRIEQGVFPAIAGRIVDLGSVVGEVRYVEPEEEAVAAALTALAAAGSDLIIIAGETSIMDRDDITPQGIRLAGGRIEHYGAPVEPGNLLLLAYYDANQCIPVLGAPGCVRSRDVNIVDLLLPRLLAGEEITRRDIIALGHGGLLS